MMIKHGVTKAIQLNPNDDKLTLDNLGRYQEALEAYY